MESFSKISKPLNNLTSDKIEFIWDSNCENAFSRLKHCLSSPLVLSFQGINEPFIVEVDARDNAIGGILLQYNSSAELHPLAYFSTTLTKSQKNWLPHSKEVYTLLMAVRH